MTSVHHIAIVIVAVGAFLVCTALWGLEAWLWRSVVMALGVMLLYVAVKGDR